MRVSRAWLWTAVVAGGAVTGLMTGARMSAQTPQQTPKNPISTKPEGQAPTCSYSGTVGSGKVSSDSNCPAQGGSTGQKFPYPGESNDTSNPFVSPPTANAPQPNANGQQQDNAPEQQSPVGTAKRFPYPGEDSGTSSSGSQGSSTPNTNDGPLKDAGSSGASSQPDSSSSSSSSNNGFFGDSDDPAEGKDDLPAPKRARKKITAPSAPEQTSDERAEEDLKVAAFYQNDGNFMGAYLRAKDAVSLSESDPEAHFMLAEAARKLGKLDEAEKNYKRCLELDPVPKQKKSSEKALKEMAGS